MWYLIKVKLILIYLKNMEQIANFFTDPFRTGNFYSLDIALERGRSLEGSNKQKESLVCCTFNFKHVGHS